MLLHAGTFKHLLTSFFRIFWGHNPQWIYSDLYIQYYSCIIYTIWDGLKLETSWNHQSVKKPDIFCPPSAEDHLNSQHSMRRGSKHHSRALLCHAKSRRASASRRWANEERCAWVKIVDILLEISNYISIFNIYSSFYQYHHYKSL